jgi:hypothetical protein
MTVFQTVQENGPNADLIVSGSGLLYAPPEVYKPPPCAKFKYR